MIRQTETELNKRLASKSLDQVLLRQLQQDFNRSPFESRAILAAVQETYLGQLRNPGQLKPGQMIVTAIKADEPPGKPLKDCQFVPIVVTVHTTAECSRTRTPPLARSRFSEAEGGGGAHSRFEPPIAARGCETTAATTPVSASHARQTSPHSCPTLLRDQPAACPGCGP